MCARIQLGKKGTGETVTLFDNEQCHIKGYHHKTGPRHGKASFGFGHESFPPGRSRPPTGLYPDPTTHDGRKFIRFLEENHYITIKPQVHFDLQLLTDHAELHSLAQDGVERSERNGRITHPANGMWKSQRAMQEAQELLHNTPSFEFEITNFTIDLKPQDYSGNEVEPFPEEQNSIRTILAGLPWRKTV